ncbi:hypothetical protein AGMMS49944_07110 [Spirochaetia bacterium]|nr:hypothetical protein AGMMS49944_07110 [Spirochaetia bacterium]
MKKKAILLLLLIISAAAVYSQTREETKIFVRPVTGGTEEESVYFHDNFIMEIEAARYMIVDSEGEADFAFRLDCVKGLDEFGEWKALEITVLELREGREVITLSCYYDELREMYDWNLYLVYQAMANVPLTKQYASIGQKVRESVYIDTSPQVLAVQAWEDQRWRNKWIYVTGYGSMGFGYGFGGGITGEFQFLNWMSVEAGVEIKYNIADPKLLINVPVLVKFPLKPSRHYMISPYLGAQYTLSPHEYSALPSFPLGVQAAVKAWSRGGFFIDIRYTLDVLNGAREGMGYYKDSIELELGYKFGWRDRASPPPPSAKEK